MKRHLLNVCSGTLLLTLNLAPAVQAQSLDELLDQAKNVRAEETRLLEQRRSAFTAAAAAEKERMMKDVEARRAQVQASVTRFADQYSANEIRINEVNGQLRDKASVLGMTELFGLSRQVAGDAATVLEQSLINAQFSGNSGQDRVDFLRQFAQSRVVPTTQELERFWLEIHQEITSSAQVARYTGTVVQPNGNPTSAQVVRIGPFSAIADGLFTTYLPQVGKLSVYPRQLPDEFLEIAADFQSATQGYVPAVVDPARGVLMNLYVERPTWGQRIHLGETVGYVIIAVGLAGALSFVYQLIYLAFARIGVAIQMKSLQKPTSNNALGRVLLAFKGDPKKIEENTDIAELRISEAVMREVPRLERFQAFLRLCVAAGPLLGLVGTVVGMIITFQSITESGSSDPKLMATGIGQAMIATVLGLGIAVPLLFANALLTSLSRGIVHILDEQSTGLLAENIEKSRHA